MKENITKQFYWDEEWNIIIIEYQCEMYANKIEKKKRKKSQTQSTILFRQKYHITAHIINTKNVLKQSPLDISI